VAAKKRICFRHLTRFLLAASQATRQVDMKTIFNALFLLDKNFLDHRGG
jgi:hypothetical protein